MHISFIYMEFFIIIIYFFLTRQNRQMLSVAHVDIEQDISCFIYMKSSNTLLTSLILPLLLYHAFAVQETAFPD